MIRIVTDSAADLTARDLETPGVTVVPMAPPPWMTAA